MKEMLAVPRAHDTNGLLRSLARIHDAIERKTLPEKMRWLTRTRLCWQMKKNRTPRPIKIGGVLAIVIR